MIDGFNSSRTCWGEVARQQFAWIFKFIRRAAYHERHPGSPAQVTALGGWRGSLWRQGDIAHAGHRFGQIPSNNIPLVNLPVETRPPPPAQT